MSWTSRVFTGIVVLGMACSDDGVPGTQQDTEASAPTTGGGGATETGQGGQDAGPDTASSADPDGGSADPDSGDTDAGDSTGGAAPPVCEDPRDCIVIDDCCTCAAVHPVEPVPACPEKECDQSMCDALGLPEDLGLACEDGACGWEPRSCSDGLVSCASVPPRCSEGTLPEVTEDGMCWTGDCIPLAACDGVPDCTWCTDTEVCVTTETQAGPTYTCEPIPEDCMRVPDCACLPRDLCPKGFTCSDTDTGPTCTCPNC